jgi:hypothetical protein
MSELLDPDDPHFNVTVEGEVYVCTPDNSLAYVHDPRFKDVDHIFRHLIEDDGEEEQGIFLFRRCFGTIFNTLIQDMTETGFTVIQAGEPSEFDWDWYVRTHTKDLDEYWEHLDGIA